MKKIVLAMFLAVVAVGSVTMLMSEEAMARTLQW